MQLLLQIVTLKSRLIASKVTQFHGALHGLKKHNTLTINQHENVKRRWISTKEELKNWKWEEADIFNVYSDR